MNKTKKVMHNQYLSFLLARIIIGTSMLGHGIVRIPKLSTFSAWMTDAFQNSLLPNVIVEPFGFVLPFVELLTGALLIAGLYTRFAIVTGAGLMVALILGSCMIEKWEFVSFQMFYGLFFVLLLSFEQFNKYSVDNLLRGGISRKVIALTQ